MKIRLSRKAGFTLVEMMIVVGVVGLLTAMAMPSFVRARSESRLRTCINNLRQIDGAKDQWALENGLATGATCNMSDILSYLKRTEPLCPVGKASYLTHTIGEWSECNSSAKTEHNAEYAP